MIWWLVGRFSRVFRFGERWSPGSRKARELGIRRTPSNGDERLCRGIAATFRKKACPERQPKGGLRTADTIPLRFTRRNLGGWKGLRPVLRAVIDAGDFNGVLLDPVNGDVGRKDQFAPPAHASGAATVGKVAQRCAAVIDGFHCLPSGGGLSFSICRNMRSRSSAASVDHRPSICIRAGKAGRAASPLARA